MNFNSYIFIFLLFPISILGYYYICSKNKYELAKYFLILVSLFFYGYAGIKFLTILTVYIIVNYVFYKYLNNKSKTFFVLDLVLNISFLLFFKYFNEVIKILNYNFDNSILFPLAISFYVFSQIDFIVKCYKNNYQYSFVDYCLYMLYFPKLIQGPIMDCQDLISQFNDDTKKRVNWDNLYDGFVLFTIGLAKKVLLADIFAKVADWGYSNISSLTTINALIVILSYTFQIYFDFSGYSDMAIGVSKMLNIDLINNFDYPYTSNNISEFWSKWHISLTKFFTRNIYIPLGGNRKGVLRTYINTLIVFIVSGLWHGTGLNYLLWGLLNGLLVVLYKTTSNKYEKLNKYFKWLLTFVVINVLWVIFRANDLSDIYLLATSLLKYNGINIIPDLQYCFDFKAFDFVSSELSFIRMFKTSRYYVLIYFVIGFILSIKGKAIKERLLNDSNKIKLLFIVFIFVYSVLSLTSMNSFVYVGY